MEQTNRVLIIDDDTTSIFISKRLMEGMHWKVQSATNGIEGLALLKEAADQQQIPNLILLDINMEGMGGFAFLEELSKLDIINLIDTKIVLLTDSQNPSVIESAKHHMAAAYLPKPLTKEKLLSVLY